MVGKTYKSTQQVHAIQVIGGLWGLWLLNGLADAREREDKLVACIDKLAENQRAMAAEIGQIREDIDEIKGEIKKNTEVVRRPGGCQVF